MKTNAERFPALVIAFRVAIYDQIKSQHGFDKVGEAGKEVVTPADYVPSTANLIAAAWPALKEVIESEAEPVDALLAVNIWKAVMLTNESAFHQQLERDLKNGLAAGIKVRKGAKAIASKYVE